MRSWGSLIKQVWKNSKGMIFFILITGLFLTFFVVNPLTQLIFHKNYFGRNLFFRISFFIIIFGTIFLIFFALLIILNHFAWFQKISCYIDNTLNSKLIKIVPIQRNIIVLILLGTGVLLCFILNNVMITIDTNSWNYNNQITLPIMTPIGIDFRVGIYQPAQNLFIGKSLQEIWQNKINTNAYPPLVAVLGLLFLPFNENTGYIIQVILLFIMNIACLAIVTELCRKFFLNDLGLDKLAINVISIFTFFAVLIYTFSSYGLSFSIERGNYDIYAIFFSLLFLRVLIHRPEKLWTQIIFLSIATHLKIYPAILFLLLFKIHKVKMIIPTLIMNFLLLFILGPNNAIAFFNSSVLSFGVGNKWSWVGNHSSYSFVEYLITNRYPNLAESFLPIWVICTLIPILIWGMATIQLFKSRTTPQTALEFFAISIPVMALVPTVSHDYKLVVLGSAVVVLISMVVRCINLNPKLSDYSLIALLLFALIFIGRSYVFNSFFNSILLKNKYPWIILLELLLFWGIKRMQSSSVMGMEK